MFSPHSVSSSPSELFSEPTNPYHMLVLSPQDMEFIDPVMGDIVKV